MSGKWISTVTFFVGAFATQSAFAFRTEYATVNLNGSGCAIASSSAGFTAANRVSTGKCDLTISGFVATPTCTTSINDQVNAGGARINSTSSSSTNVRVVTVDIDSVLTDYSFNVICMGN